MVVLYGSYITLSYHKLLFDVIFHKHKTIPQGVINRQIDKSIFDGQFVSGNNIFGRRLSERY